MAIPDPRANLSHQLDTLCRTYRMLLAEGDIQRADLKAKVISAQAVVEDGSEIDAMSFDGQNQQAAVMYPKEVVIAAALNVYEESDPANPYGSADQSVVSADLSRTRIES